MHCEWLCIDVRIDQPEKSLGELQHPLSFRHQLETEARNIQLKFELEHACIPSYCLAHVFSDRTNGKESIRVGTHVQSPLQRQEAMRLRRGIRGKYLRRRHIKRC